ncbi:MAG: hypothetical protein ACI8WB_000070, partial [Phenylobacterium sp.]
MKKLLLALLLLILPTQTWAAATTGYTFGTNGQNIQIDAAITPLNGLTTFTLEFWANFSDVTQPIVMWEMPANDSAKLVWGGFSNNRLVSDFDGASLNAGDFNQSTTTVTINTGTWYHFVWVFDSGTWDFYQDGSLVGTANVADTSTLGGSVWSALTSGTTLPDMHSGGVTTLQFGSNFVGAANSMQGTIDDIRFYKTARTAGEVSTAYNGGSPVELTTLSDTNLIGYWKLNETTGQTVADSQTGNTTYNGFLGDNNSDATNDPTIGVTAKVSSASVTPTISSVTYDPSTGNLVVTGTNFEAQGGGTNDVTVNKLKIIGEGGSGSEYTLTSATNIERDSATQFTIPISGVDKRRVDALLNKNLTVADDSTAYNLATLDDFIANITTGNTAIPTSEITVSNYANPAITSATYDASSGALVVTGTRMSSVSASNSDVVANTITLSATTGDSYTLTDTANVGITSETAFTVTLSTTDQHHVNGILNKDLLNADDGKLYNIAVADNWMAGGAGNVDIKDLTVNGVTVSNSANPTMTAATYDATTGVLMVTGTNFVNKVGASDIDLTKLTLKGEGSNTHTLTAVNVEITDASSFSATLTAADKIIVNGLLNKDLTVADDNSTTYNLDAADNYMVAARTSQPISDATNGVSVSNVVVPAIASATYNASTKALVVTGSGFARKFSGDDINVAKLSLVGQASGEYTLTSSNVEITSETEFTVTLTDTDKLNVNGLLNKDVTQADDNTVYNLKGAEDWQQGAATGAVTVDNGVNAVTVSSSADPVITSAAYDSSTGILSVAGTRFVKKLSVNDVDLTKITLLGQGSGTHTLSSGVEISSENSFNVTLTGGDKTSVDALLNKDGVQADDNVVYNLNAAEDWMTGAAPNNSIVDATLNAITVSNVPVPSITSSAYNFSTGVLVATGVNFVSGGSTDVTANLFTFTGEAGATYILTDTANVNIDSVTGFTLTLSDIDKINVNGLLNKDVAQSDSGTSYNLAAADNFMANVTAGNTADATTGVTVSAVAQPVITDASYNFGTGVLVVNGTSFSKKVGTTDVNPAAFTLTGDGGDSYVLTTAAQEISSETSISVTLNATDQLFVNGLLNKDGAASVLNTTYNLGAADNWMAGGAPNTNIEDLTLNGITVSGVVNPTIISALYDATSGALVVTGSGFAHKSGVTNDIVTTTITLSGHGNYAYTLTDASVEITNTSTFTINLSATDIHNANGLFTQDGTTSHNSSNYLLQAADNWLAAGPEGNIADITSNTITVSNVVAPAVTAATYDATSGVFAVTGTRFVNQVSSADVDLHQLILTGEAGATYTLTSTSVEITDASSFSATLNTADKLVVNGLLNKNGTQADDGATNYNLNAQDNYMIGANTNTDIADAVNAITVSNVLLPTIIAATYDASTGILTVAGANFSHKSAGDDIDVTKLILNGEGNISHVLTSANVEITDSTNFSVTLNAADKLVVNGLMNKDGLIADGGATYNLAGADNWLAGAATNANIADLTLNAVTVSNVAAPIIDTATYDATSGILVVTGINFVSFNGVTNDVDISTLTFTGEGPASYTIVSTSDVEVTSATEFTVTLSGADRTNVDGILNKNGTVSATSSTTFNLAAADNWMLGAAANRNIEDLTNNTITVTNLTSPTITSATYDATSGVVLVTGTFLRNKSGSANDVDVSLMTFTGDSGSTYTVTSTTDVEIDSQNGFSVTLSGADKTNVDGLLDKNSVTSDSGTTYNLAVADNWMPGAAATTDIKDLTNNGITVTNVTVPAVTSVAYNFTTGVFLATGTNLRNKVGANNDVDLTKLALKGEGSNSYTLTGSSVEITSVNGFTATMSETDKININGLLNKDGTNADDNVLYNLATADNWMAGAAPTTDIADATSGVTVNSVVTPSITSIAYDYTTGIVTITGLNFVKKFGSANDIDISLLTFTGENGATYTISSAVDIELTSSTSFTFTLSGADLTGVTALITANGTTAGSGTAYNVAAADNWMTGTAASASIADTTGNAINVSNVPTPTITSASYNASTAVLTVTGTNYVDKSGVDNDVSVSKLTFKGQGAATYTLTSSDVEITNAATFSVTLNAADKLNIHGLLNTDGTVADDATVYNIAAADDFIAQTTAGDSSDSTSNAITVTGVAVPTIISATYDATSGVMVVIGTDLVHLSGATNDVDISLMTVTGEAGAAYTVTSTSNVEVTDASSFSVTLSGVDKTNIDGLLNKNGTSSDSTGATYNLAVADNWLAGAAGTANIADTTANGISVANVTTPTIISASYNATSGALVVTGSNLRNLNGSSNDVDISTLTLTGEAGATYTITSTSDIDISSATEFTVTLSGSDKTNVDGLLNKNGTSADNSATTYNLAGADNWLPGTANSTDIADATNAITVTNVTTPLISGASYSGINGTLTVFGSNFSSKSGVTNDVAVSLLTLKGQASGTYTLTTTDVEISSSTSFTVTLNAADKTAIAVLLNSTSTRAYDNTLYNLAAADNWMAGAALSTDIADATNGINVNSIATPSVTLSASSNNIIEAAGTSVLTATLSAITSANVTVNVGLTYSGTGVVNTDYTATGSSIVIDQGGISGSVTVQALPDSLFEGSTNKTIIADITSTNNTTENGVQTQTINIIEDESAPLITLSASSNAIAETGGSSTLTATSNVVTTADITVGLAYSGTATNGTDYGTGASSITITAGQTTATTSLTTTSDANVEGSESLIVDISSVTGGATNSATESSIQQQIITISDDDSATVTLSVDNNTIAEAAGTSTVTATLSSATFENVTVSLGYSGTASNGTDYSTPAGSITIVAGQTSGSTTLTATADTGVEVSETIIVDIIGVSGGSASESSIQQQTVTITDDDVATVTLTASTNSIAEAAGSSIVTATLSGTTYETVTVSLGFSGTATSTEYSASATSITIAAGQTTGTATLTAIADTSVEASETIIVDITGVSGGSASESGLQQQTVTITDDDTATVSLAVSSNTIAEAAGTSTISATLNTITFENVTVSLDYSGTATSTEYTASATSITIAAGQTTGTATITATDDSTVEASETIIVAITGVSGGSASESGSQQQTVTITDDDTANVSLTVSSTAIIEGSGASTITATLSQVSFESVTVNLAYSGTATSGVDYTSPASSITIAAGQTSATTTLTAIQDATEEANETIIVDISSVSGGSASENGTQQQTVSITNDDDQTAPTNYSVTIDAVNINTSNENSLSFSFSNAEIGATYSYSVADSNGRPAQARGIETNNLVLDGTGTVTASSQTIGNINIAALADGLITLNVILTDAAGNVGATASASVSKDTVIPTATLTTAATDPTTGTFDVSITFNEAVTGFALTDVALSNAQVFNLQGSGASYTLTVTPSVEGEVIVGLVASGVQDAAGNVNDAAQLLQLQYDPSAPLIATVAPANNAIDVAVKPDLVITFNENISAASSNNLIEIHLTSTDAVIESIPADGSAVSISDNVATITLGTDLAGSTNYYINIAAGAFVDSAGNGFAGFSDSSSWGFRVITVIPGTTDDSATVDEDAVVAIDVLANDPGEGSELNPASVTVQTAALHGATSINTANGFITYSPENNFVGSDTFSYVVTDLSGLVLPEATVTVTVSNVND